jgi:U3 small nucleolar RNA-associated protein 22
MPGIKRKANPPPPRASTSKIPRQPAKKQLRPASPSEDDGESAFDAPAYLRPAPTARGHGMADSDDAYSGSLTDEDLGEDQPALTMMSDEDMEGGFEDLEEEGGELNGGQYEDSDGDEDDFEDLEAEAEEIGKPTKGAKSKEALYAPPTNEEMQGLRETGELFKSNVIKLQVSKTT